MVKNKKPEDLDNLHKQIDLKPEKLFKTGANQITPKVVENWINQTLKEAEDLGIPSCLLLPKNKIPISRYGIDRITLVKAGITNEGCDRIYRSLFVYSVGYF